MPKHRPESIRPERVAEQIRVDVAHILQGEMKDPRLHRVQVTCTRVSLTKDLRFAKLYVSLLGDEERKEAALKALERATGYVRRRLARQLGLRAAPEIRFVYDPSVEYGIRLEKLIEETKSEPRSDAFDGEGDDDGEDEPRGEGEG